MAEKTVALIPDEVQAAMTGTPAPAQQGSLTIKATPGNPDATVNLPGYEDQDGVEVGGIDPQPKQPPKTP